MKNRLHIITLGLFFAGLLTVPAFASDYSAEVMAVKGTAFVVSEKGDKVPIKEGDLLKAGAKVEVGADSFVDLAYDSHWNNMSRIGADSEVKIQSIYPTGLFVAKGDVLAKLHKLPTKSTFEVETPTAVAAVRGSEYRTVYRDGVTDVFNLHTSNVEVYGKDPSGNIKMDEPVILKEFEKTAVNHLGEAPRMPEVMRDKEKNENQGISDGMKKEAEVRVTAGDVGKTQDIEVVNKVYADDLAKRMEAAGAPAPGSHDNDAAQPDTKGNGSGNVAPVPVPVKGPADGVVGNPDAQVQKIDKISDKLDGKVQEIVDHVEKKTQDIVTRTENDQNRKDDGPVTVVDPSKNKDSGSGGNDGQGGNNNRQSV